MAGRQPPISVDVSRAVGLFPQSGGPLQRLLLHPPSLPRPFRGRLDALGLQPQLDPAADLFGLGDTVPFLEDLEPRGQLGIDVEVHAVSHETIIHDIEIYVNRYVDVWVDLIASIRMGVLLSEGCPRVLPLAHALGQTDIFSSIFFGAGGHVGDAPGTRSATALRCVRAPFARPQPKRFVQRCEEPGQRHPERAGESVHDIQRRRLLPAL